MKAIDLRHVDWELDIVRLRDFLSDQPIWPDEILITHRQYNEIRRSQMYYEGCELYPPKPMDFGFKDCPPVKVNVRELDVPLLPPV